VALLGFAYRQISIKFTQKTRKPSQPKPLPASVKNISDWIKLKLHERKMAPYQLAEKMGIASSLVKAWKDGTVRPKACHVWEMVRLLGKHCRVPADAPGN
jgi:ribosome-binding protein aMBF1 (putative translation factor)